MTHGEGRWLARMSAAVARKLSSPKREDDVAVDELERGQSFQRAGRLEEAKAAYEALLARSPARADVCHVLGGVLHQTGDAAGALAMLQRAAALAPRSVSVRCDLGLMLHWSGAHSQAEAQLREAIAIDPASDQAYANLALARAALGDSSGAEQCFRDALSRNPRNPTARANLARLCLQTGRPDASVIELEVLVAEAPANPSLWHLLGTAHGARGDWTSADRCFRRALEIDALRADTLSSLGFALSSLGRYAEGKDACSRALSLRPDWTDGMVNLAIVTEAGGELEPAKALCNRVLEIDPRNAAAKLTLGTVERALGNMDAALQCFRDSAQLDPASAAARYNLATTLIQTDRYVEGFELLESRSDAYPNAYSASGRRLLARADRRWKGRGDIRGRRLLVWAEQGYGDAIMMLRYLPALTALGAAVTVVCSHELTRLVEAVAGEHRVVGWDSVDAIEYDLHCPMMSLPYCLGTTLLDVPHPEGYITLSPTDCALWAERLQAFGGYRVGVVWAGSSTLKDDDKRSVPWNCFRVLTVMAPSVSLVSLQKDATPAQLSDLSMSLDDPVADCVDFYDTACLMTGLDLVISVDTAVAHLAGATGRPVWMLDRAGSEWRWGLVGERTPWYASMRLIRQAAGVSWERLLERVGEDLAQVCNGSRAEPGERGSRSLAAR